MRTKRGRSQIVVSEAALRGLADKLMKLDEWAFDTEIMSDVDFKVYGPNKAFKCVGISISWGSNNTYYIPINHKYTKNQLPEYLISEILHPVFTRKDIRLIGHNMDFDMHVFERLGIKILTDDLWDTQIAGWVIDENQFKAMDACTKREYGVDQGKFSEQVAKVSKERKLAAGLKASQKATMDLTYVHESAPYALDDAFYTWCLYRTFSERIAKRKLTKIFKGRMEFLRVIHEMEAEGIDVDIEAAKEMEIAMQKDLDEMMYRMVELVGTEFNPSSTDQKRALLFGFTSSPKKDKLTPTQKICAELAKYSFGFESDRLTKKGGLATDDKSVMLLSGRQPKTERQRQGLEFLGLLRKFSRLQHLQSNFIGGITSGKNIYDDGRIHTNFKIDGTDTARLSSSSPNIQNLPRNGTNDTYEIRRLFYVKEEGYTLIACDESNLETRIMAHTSQDEGLLEMFANNDDSHGTTAVRMFDLKCHPNEVKKLYPSLRQSGKTLSFAIGYGAGAQKLYENLRDDEFSPIDLGAKEYLEQYKHTRVYLGRDKNNKPMYGPPKEGKHIAQIYIDKYFAAYPGIKRYQDTTKKLAHKQGYVQTITGRKRTLPEINCGVRHIEASWERKAVNATIQGSAADIVSAAQIRLARDPEFIALGGVMILQVHDEIVAKCPEKNKERVAEIIKYHMENPFGEKVKLNGVDLIAEYGFGATYSEAK